MPNKNVYYEQDDIVGVHSYYDILEEVLEQPVTPDFCNIAARVYGNLNLRIEDDDRNPGTTQWYGFIEDCALELIQICCDYLTQRDKVPTFISGLFYHISSPLLGRTCISLIRNCPGIFREYVMTHTSLIYRQADLRLDRNGYIDPSIIINPSKDINGYYVYTLLVAGHGYVSIPVHTLVGMTYHPRMYQTDMFTYFHLDGDITYNHFQNIGITNA